jgi:hypothetical protein
VWLLVPFADRERQEERRILGALLACSKSETMRLVDEHVIDQNNDLRIPDLQTHDPVDWS